MATRAKEHFFTGESNSKMRSKKVFDFGVFLAQWETFLDRVLAFDPTGGSCSNGRVATAKCSQIPYWSAPAPAILLTKFGLFACYRDLGL